MTQELAVPETVEGSVVAYTPPTPEEYIAFATRQANALKGVVDKQTLYSIIQGKKFPKAEAWQTIVALDGACPITRYCEPVQDNEEKITGYTAHVEIVKQGEVIASGTMVCGFDDFPCRGKNGTAKHRAAMSAAQTWAGAKAARMRYAWVMTLAGYEPTPAEEMHGVGEEAPEKPAQPSTSKSRPAEPEPAKEKPKANPVEAIRQAATTWNHDHPDQPIKEPEILRGLKALYGVEADSAEEGLAQLPIEQARDMWKLIAQGQYLSGVEYMETPIEAGVTEAKEEADA